MGLLFSVGFPTGMEGLTYPIPFSDPESLVQIAKHAEALGYHSVWGNDHMTTQNYVRAEFPVPPRFWEPLVTYSFLAAHTTTLRFGTGVLVLPMRRDIVVTAKQIATLDHLSNGRVEIGVGVGAYREEFEALNPDGKVHRGDMVEEGVKALQSVVLGTQRIVRREVLQVQRRRALSEAEAEAAADLLRGQQSEPSAPDGRIGRWLDTGGSSEGDVEAHGR